MRVLTDGPPARADGDARIAGGAVRTFGAELLRAAVAEAPDGNVVVSPTSVAIALAMLEPGAVGDARQQLRAVLRIDDASAFHGSLSAVAQSLAGRSLAAPTFPGEEAGELTARIASAAFLQQGYPVEAAYLATIGRHHGPVLREVDYEPDPDAVAREINRFVAEETAERIPALIADGVLAADTALTLVNALYLKVSWQTAFRRERSEDHDFTRLDGSTARVPLMRGHADATARGDGWVGATKAYVGHLEAQIVLPDEGRFDEVVGRLAPAFDSFTTDRRGGAALSLPRFVVRHHQELSPALRSLGLVAPYERGGLLGIADDDRLLLDAVLHETYLAVDEEGTEAAAATASVMRATGRPVEPPAPVVVDRPFAVRIHDHDTDATLFAGLILDPSA